MQASCPANIVKLCTAHQGTFVFATTRGILENQRSVVAPVAWSSKKVPRVVRSCGIKHDGGSTALAQDFVGLAGGPRL